MRKPDFCLCESKGADQLCSNCEADQPLCFRYRDSTVPLLSKSKNFQPLAIFCDCIGWFVSDLVGNPEDPFSRVAAHIILCRKPRRQSSCVSSHCHDCKCRKHCINALSTTQYLHRAMISSTSHFYSYPLATEFQKVLLKYEFLLFIPNKDKTTSKMVN